MARKKKEPNRADALIDEMLEGLLKSRTCSSTNLPSSIPVEAANHSNISISREDWF
ncbi:hypothetical protein U2F10_02920 [Leptothoe sp. EHU-05/26/07-4]